MAYYNFDTLCIHMGNLLDGYRRKDDTNWNDARTELLRELDKHRNATDSSGFFIIKKVLLDNINEAQTEYFKRRDSEIVSIASELYSQRRERNTE